MNVLIDRKEARFQEKQRSTRPVGVARYHYRNTLESTCHTFHINTDLAIPLWGAVTLTRGGTGTFHNPQNGEKHPILILSSPSVSHHPPPDILGLIFQHVTEGSLYIHTSLLSILE